MRVRLISSYFSFKLVVFLGMFSLALPAYPGAPLIRKDQAVRDGERLSQWLLRRKSLDDDYLSATIWKSKKEIENQNELKSKLLNSARKNNLDENLIQWIEGRPVTGRVALGIVDGLWLAINTADDPVLRVDDQIIVPARVSNVSVLLENGDVCQAQHQPGGLIQEYLSACGLDYKDKDVAWVAQPNGQQESYGIASWNAEAQNFPQPGAWIWAPSKTNKESIDFSELLIRFVATQGIANERGMPPISSSLPSIKSWTTNGLLPNFNQAKDAIASEIYLTSNDWGEIGLLQTPTARMVSAGSMRVHISRVQPYTRATVMLQPLDWLEGGFRYTDISDLKYDPNGIIASQSLKDKSLDVKFRLWPESKYIPEIAFGVRDMGGTGLFSSEYLVGSKRIGYFDWSVGIGWGYLAHRDDFSNPLGFASEKMIHRPVKNIGEGGEVGLNSMFRGPAAIFGGVQWQSPLSPWILKLELDGNNYSREPAGREKFSQKSPLNFGAVYRYSKNTDLSLGFERGNKLSLGITFRSNWSQAGTVKAFDPVAPMIEKAYPLKDNSVDQIKVNPSNINALNKTVEEINKLTNWSVKSISPDGNRWEVRVEENGALYRNLRVEKALAVLHRDAPQDIEYFDILFVNRGMLITMSEFDRGNWVKQRLAAHSPKERREIGYEKKLSSNDFDYLSKSSNSKVAAQGFVENKKFSIGLSPSFLQSFGGPDTFMLYQVGVRANAQYQLSSSTWLNANANLRVVDNYDKFKYTAPSELPRVRTNVREYVTDSRLTIDNFQLSHVKQISPNNFASVYGGLLESMFAGAGAEWLYRPIGSKWALGVDVNHVKQRGFDQKFSMRDYKVTTGHATLYWDTGWNGLRTKLSVGQYLAGDKGATLDLSRTFENGVTIGGWATKTNVSAEQFGEGSFDKGLYVRIPFDIFLPRSSSASGTFIWQPLLRDGGARLGRGVQLHSLTDARDPMAWEFKPVPSIPERQRTGADIFSH